jgi:hypothetical protein
MAEEKVLELELEKLDIAGLKRISPALGISRRSARTERPQSKISSPA